VAGWKGRVVPDEGLTPEVVQALQDRVLASMDGRGQFDHAALRELPPWRAVVLVRLAHRAGDVDREGRDAVIREAAMAASRGEGRLRPWSDEVRLRASGQRRRP
jgi:hypothetical protein